MNSEEIKAKIKASWAPKLKHTITCFRCEDWLKPLHKISKNIYCCEECFEK